jgi:integrase
MKGNTAKVALSPEFLSLGILVLRFREIDFLTFTVRWRSPGKDAQIFTGVVLRYCDERVIPLVGKAYKLVSNLPRSSIKLFPGSNIRYFWEKAVKEANIKDFRFHDLRHTAGSYLAQQGVPLLTIGNILGHRSIATTTKYTHLSVDHLKTPLSNLNDMMFPD